MKPPKDRAIRTHQNHKITHKVEIDIDGVKIKLEPLHTHERHLISAGVTAVILEHLIAQGIDRNEALNETANQMGVSPQQAAAEAARYRLHKPLP